MQKFDAIRPFYDSEINEALHNVVNHPMMKALMNFTFPDVADEVWKEQLRKTHSIRDFQCNFIYKSLSRLQKLDLFRLDGIPESCIAFLS
jgi:hypothetical protein